MENILPPASKSRFWWLNRSLKVLTMVGVAGATVLVILFTQGLIYSDLTGGWGSLGMFFFYATYILPIGCFYVLLTVLNLIRKMWAWAIVSFLVSALFFSSPWLALYFKEWNPKVIQKKQEILNQQQRNYALDLEQARVDSLYPHLLFDVPTTLEMLAGEEKNITLQASFRDESKVLKVKLVSIHQLSSVGGVPRFVSLTETKNNASVLKLSPQASHVGEWDIDLEVYVEGDETWFKDYRFIVKVLPKS